MVSKPGRGPFRGRPRARPTSSRPTDRRSSPSGTRSPSQRWRDSMSECDAAQARRVRDHARRRLDASRGVAVGDVERHQPAEAGIAHDRHAPGARRAGARARARSRSGARRGTASVCRLRSSSQHGSGAATMPVVVAELAQARGVLLALAHDGAEEHVVVPAEVLRRAVEDEVGAVLERAQVDRRRGGRVDDDRRRMRGCGLEVGHRQERVRRRLEPDELHAVRRCAGLVELDDVQPPALERREEAAGAEVRAVGERDRRAGLEQRERERGRRARPGREEQRVPAVELAERLLGRDAGRVRVALVVEVARLAALVVRPDRRAVEAHAPTLFVAPQNRCQTPFVCCDISSTGTSALDTGRSCRSRIARPRPLAARHRLEGTPPVSDTELAAADVARRGTAQRA